VIEGQAKVKKNLNMVFTSLSLEIASIRSSAVGKTRIQGCVSTTGCSESLFLEIRVAYL